MKEKKCKNNKCMRVLSNGYKFDYCENCRNEQAKNVKNAGKGLLGIVGVVGSIAIAIITKKGPKA